MPSISSFGSLQTSLRGLLAHQRMLDVTSHNVSNADTVGYTRQSAATAAATGIQVGGASVGGSNWLGQGVDVTSYNRIRDEFLDVSSRAQTMLLGQRGALAEGLSRADAVLGEPGTTGISALMGKLWNSFQTLSTNPSDSAARAGVITAAQAVADGFAQLDQRLAAISTDAATEFASITASPNGKVAASAKELAELNDSISRAVAAGQQPNDMLDRRDLLLDELSSLGQVSVTDLGYGKISVSFGNTGTPLVDGTTQPSSTTWPQALTNPGGQLGGLIDAQTTIASYRSALDGAVSALASSVNAIHGTPPFFTGSTAATLAVGVTAATLTPGSTAAPEANDLARALAGLRGGAAERTYQDIVERIGSDASSATSLRNLSISLVNDVESRRQSVAGVSLDEEMTNMIRFQRGYQASSRAMSSIDEMLDQLINRTGRVGL